MSYEQTVLRRIRDQFSKEEAIAELLKRLSKKDIEIGILVSEKEELKDYLSLCQKEKSDLQTTLDEVRFAHSKKAEKAIKKKYGELMYEHEDLKKRHLSALKEINLIKTAQS